MSVAYQADRDGYNDTAPAETPPARQRWFVKAEQEWFERGWAAAGNGQPRTRYQGPLAYNERAAFMDEWDCFHDAQRSAARVAWQARRLRPSHLAS